MFQCFFVTAAILANPYIEPTATLQLEQRTTDRIVLDKSDSDQWPGFPTVLRTGRDHITRFFGRKFPNEVNVQVCPHRAAFDEYLRKRWNIPKTEPWMVAMGVGDKLLILSPKVWKTEAIEHDPDNPEHVRLLVLHEMVHVYHGQVCPKHDFDGMDDLGWFVEGLATYVSGQLEKEHSTDAREAIKGGKAPIGLKDAWSGRYRYGVSGSMVGFVDRTYGRETIKKLLAVTTPFAALATLKTTEEQFLMNWRKYVLSQK